MDDRFDDLSRAMASPLPRRRFVALMGAAVAVMAGGLGLLRPQPAGAGACGGGGTCASPKGQCCTDQGSTKTQYCCPDGFTCPTAAGGDYSKCGPRGK